MPQSQSLARASKALDGVETEVAIRYYADRVLVLVTQLGKVGNLLQASIPASAQLLMPSLTTDALSLIEPSPSIELIPLFGSAPSQHLATLHSLYASHIATLLWTRATAAHDDGDRRSVVVGLALKKAQHSDVDGAELTVGEQSTFKSVMGMIIELLRDTEK